MTIVLAVSAALVAVVVAARSTWSPCGVSMLATITPLAETGRGHRYRSTALWFVAGAAGGGLMLGLVLGALAIGLGAAAPSVSARAALACAVALVCAASDARVGGFALPVHHRQVNERWLDQFRAWVYGAGFGWQIGTGFVTYIKTAGVYLMAFLAVLTGSWWMALSLGVLFGLVRGLAVFLGRSIASQPPWLRSTAASRGSDPSSSAWSCVSRVRSLCSSGGCSHRGPQQWWRWRASRCSSPRTARRRSRSVPAETAVLAQTAVPVARA